MTYPDKLRLEFDGSCPGPNTISGYAWILKDFEGKVVDSGNGVICEGKGATNNIAEWGGLVRGLENLAEKQWNGELQIWGDSQLIIRQLVGQYAIRKPEFVPFYNKAHEILNKIQRWDAEWFPRKQNEGCDSLSKKASGVGQNPPGTFGK